MSYRLVCTLRELLYFCIFVFIMPAKRKSLCPGCKTLKKNHAFAAPSKHCTGQPVNSVKNKILDDELSASEELPPCQRKSVSSPSAGSGPQKQLESQELLDAMRNLSLQLEGLTAEQTTMKNRMVAVQAQGLAILCCWLNKHPKPSSMVSTWISYRYYLL